LVCIEILVNKKEIIWQRATHKRGIVLIANTVSDYSNPGMGLNEEDMVPVQQWCDEHECGLRISFDMFRFKNEAEVVAFLLRWS
jgi:hypothetical protein